MERSLPAIILILFITGLLSCSERQSPNNAISAEEANALLDNWHKAAATANAELFFGSMTQDAIYLGTDPAERWQRDELRQWSKKFFDRDKAWDFKPLNRELYFSADKETLWFEETLDTWMGTCRGSGVVIQEDEGLKIAHYNLAVLIENEKIQDFISLREQELTTDSIAN